MKNYDLKFTGNTIIRNISSNTIRKTYIEKYSVCNRSKLFVPESPKYFYKILKIVRTGLTVHLKKMIENNLEFYDIAKKYIKKFDVKYNTDWNFSREGIERFQRKLIENEINIKKFNSFLNKTEGLVAGSFPLQALINKKWDKKNKKPDIDIFIPLKNIELMVNKKISKKSNFEKILKEFTKKYFNVSKNIFIKKIVHTKDTKGLGGYNFISYRIKCNNGNCDLDLILVDFAAKEFIKTFDFDICKVYYDGKKLDAINRTVFLDNTCVNNYICNKLKGNVKKLEQEGRVSKYRERGFAIINTQKHITLFIKKLK